MLKKNIFVSFIAFISVCLFSNVSLADKNVNSNDEINVANVIEKSSNLFYTELDSLGRPSYAHALINKSYLPSGDRPKDTPNPAALPDWLSNQIIPSKLETYGTEKEYSSDDYVWNRGHGIGYQFLGTMSNTPDNIVPMTSYLNSRVMLKIEGYDSTISLKGWLSSNKKMYLDYYVFYSYDSDADRIPSKIILSFRGLNSDNNYVVLDNTLVDIDFITINNDGLVLDVSNRGYTSALLFNYQPETMLSYIDGSASLSSGSNRDSFDSSFNFDYSAFISRDPSSVAVSSTGEYTTNEWGDKVKVDNNNSDSESEINKDDLKKNSYGKYIIVAIGIGLLLLISFVYEQFSDSSGGGK